MRDSSAGAERRPGPSAGSALWTLGGALAGLLAGAAIGGWVGATASTRLASDFAVNLILALFGGFAPLLVAVLFALYEWPKRRAGLVAIAAFAACGSLTYAKVASVVTERVVGARIECARRHAEAVALRIERIAMERDGAATSGDFAHALGELGDADYPLEFAAADSGAFAVWFDDPDWLLWTPRFQVAGERRAWVNPSD